MPFRIYAFPLHTKRDIRIRMSNKPSDSEYKEKR